MATTQFVAFLRAVNVGGRVVKMAELKRIFEGLGFLDVSTFIASGNVVFGAPANDHKSLESRIETALAHALGYPVATMVRRAGEVAAVAAAEPFQAAVRRKASLYVGFLQSRPTPRAVAQTLSLQTEVDRLKLGGREIYWLAFNNMARATVSSAAIEKSLKVAVTFRNMNTVQRLAAKLADRG